MPAGPPANFTATLHLPTGRSTLRLPPVEGAELAGPGDSRQISVAVVRMQVDPAA